MKAARIVRHKSQALDKLADFKLGVAGSNQLATKVLWPYQGGEFTDITFQQFSKDEWYPAGLHSVILSSPEWDSRKSMVFAHERNSLHVRRQQLPAVIVGGCFSDSCIPGRLTANSSQQRGDRVQAVAREISSCMRRTCPRLAAKHTCTRNCRTEIKEDS